MPFSLIPKFFNITSIVCIFFNKNLTLSFFFLILCRILQKIRLRWERRKNKRYNLQIYFEVIKFYNGFVITSQ
jgi:hypothetical protein